MEDINKVLEMLDEIRREQALIRKELGEMSEKIDKIYERVPVYPEVRGAISAEEAKRLKIPKTCTQTLEALVKLGGEASAYQIANLTGRARSTESGCLNQLWEMGYLEKFQDGRIVKFRLIKSPEGEEL